MFGAPPDFRSHYYVDHRSNSDKAARARVNQDGDVWIPLNLFPAGNNMVVHVSIKRVDLLPKSTTHWIEYVELLKCGSEAFTADFVVRPGSAEPFPKLSNSTMSRTGYLKAALPFDISTTI